MSPRAIRLACFVVAICVVGEIATYHILANLVGRVALGRTEGLEMGVVAFQVYRVLPIGLAFLVVAVGAIVLVNLSKPNLLWPVVVGLLLLNVALLVWSVSEAYGQLDRARQWRLTSVPTFSAELGRLGVRSALVFQSQALDEEPVWSPDGSSIAVNLEGSWRRVDLSRIVLAKAEWHGGSPLGFAQSPSLSPLAGSDLELWKAKGGRDPRRVKTRSGTIVEMKSEDLGTAFVITLKGKAPQVLWKTSLENCHSLALSPDEQFVAFICELNGLAVTKL